MSPILWLTPLPHPHFTAERPRPRASQAFLNLAQRVSARAGEGGSTAQSPSSYHSSQNVCTQLWAQLGLCTGLEGTPDYSRWRGRSEGYPGRCRGESRMGPATTIGFPVPSQLRPGRRPLPPALVSQNYWRVICFGCPECEFWQTRVRPIPTGQSQA